VRLGVKTLLASFLPEPCALPQAKAHNKRKQCAHSPAESISDCFQTARWTKGVGRWLSEDPIGQIALGATPGKSTLHVFEDGILEARENKSFLVAQRMLAKLSANTLAFAR